MKDLEKENEDLRQSILLLQQEVMKLRQPIPSREELMKEVKKFRKNYVKTWNKNGPSAYKSQDNLMVDFFLANLPPQMEINTHTATNSEELAKQAVELSKTIFYLPATNGKAQDSIKKGAGLIIDFLAANPLKREVRYPEKQKIMNGMSAVDKAYILGVNETIDIMKQLNQQEETK